MNTAGARERWGKAWGEVLAKAAKVETEADYLNWVTAEYEVVPDPAPTKPNDTESNNVTDGWREVLDSWCKAALERGEPHWVSPTDFDSDVKFSPFDKAVYAVFDEARELLLRKHADYGPKNISGSPGGPLNGLRVRAWDKIARINNLIDSGAEPEHESLRDSFLDLANYALIGLLVLDGSWPE